VQPDAAEVMTAEPFRVVYQQIAAEQCYPGFECLPTYDREYHSAVYEFDGDTPLRLVGADGGEPEDQSLHRDWKWVVTELNKMAHHRSSGLTKIAELRKEHTAELDRIADVFADSQVRTLNELEQLRATNSEQAQRIADQSKAISEIGEAISAHKKDGESVFWSVETIAGQVGQHIADLERELETARSRFKSGAGELIPCTKAGDHG
jgi:hypothetical protein